MTGKPAPEPSAPVQPIEHRPGQVGAQVAAPAERLQDLLPVDPVLRQRGLLCFLDLAALPQRGPASDQGERSVCGLRGGMVDGGRIG